MQAFFQLRQYQNSGNYVEYWGPSPPSATTDVGPYKVDDVVWNDACSIGSPIGWVCTTAGANGSVAVFTPFGFIGNPVAISTDSTHTVGFTLSAAQVTGGTANVTLILSGTLGAGANAQLPTVAALIAATPGFIAGYSYNLRIVNTSSGAYAWTVTTNSGSGTWTLTGTMSIAQNTFRDFVVTVTSLTTPAATITSVATGTYS